MHRYDLKARKANVVISRVNAFEMAQNGKKYLYSQKGRWFIGTLKPMPPSGAPSPPPSAARPSGKALATQKIEIKVKPREEWRQMYREAWRIEREFFYDPGLHGLDLKKAQKQLLKY